MERTQHLYDSLVAWAGKLNFKKCSEHLLRTTKLNAETSKKKIVHIGQKEPFSFFPFSTYNKIELEPKTHALDFTDCLGEKMRNQWRNWMQTYRSAKSEGKNGFRVPPQITQHFTSKNTSDFDGITYMEPDSKIVTLRSPCLFSIQIIA